MSGRAKCPRDVYTGEISPRENVRIPHVRLATHGGLSNYIFNSVVWSRVDSRPLRPPPLQSSTHHRAVTPLSVLRRVAQQGIYLNMTISGRVNRNALELSSRAVPHDTLFDRSDAPFHKFLSERRSRSPRKCQRRLLLRPSLQQNSTVTKLFMKLRL